MNPANLLTKWRERATILEDNGAPDAAFIWRKAASELEAWFDETITPAQAEAEGLGDAETVARKLREGRLPNRGRKYYPLVRRRDLLFPLQVERGHGKPRSASLLTIEAVAAKTLDK